MWPYLILFLLPAFFAISRLSTGPNFAVPKKHDRWPNTWRILFVSLALIIGLRHEVGGDWIQYIEMLDSNANFDTAEIIRFQDPAFVLLNMLATWSGAGVYLINLISAIFFSWGLVVFCRELPRPWLAVVVAVPYLITVVAMGYTRQGVAIGIAMVAMVALGQGNALRFFIWIVLAALFHKSAIILLPLAILANSKNRILTLLWVSIAGLILFALLLQEASSFLIYGYIESQYQSSGAAIRIAMNALPGLIFLLYIERFQLSHDQQSFWKWMAWGSLLFIPLLLVSPSSTAVDRLALYWIPLQLFVLSRFPNAIGQKEGKNAALQMQRTRAGWVTYSNGCHCCN